MSDPEYENFKSKLSFLIDYYLSESRRSIIVNDDRCGKFITKVSNDPEFENYYMMWGTRQGTEMINTVKISLFPI